MDKDKKYNKIKGGKADKLTPQGLARKHCVFIGTIEKEIAAGVKIEMEHTNDKDLATEIAMDHIYEFVDYYTNKAGGLKASEKKMEKNGEVKTEGFLSLFKGVVQETISKYQK